MEKHEGDSKTPQLIEDLRTSVEIYKRDFDAAQNENYRLTKQLNSLKDDSDNKDTQIRRLNQKIVELKEELTKIKTARNKEKELLYHRKNETLKLLKLVAGLLRSLALAAAEVPPLVEAVLLELRYAPLTRQESKANVSLLVAGRLASCGAKLQEPIDGIVAFSKAIKEAEPLADLARPFEVKPAASLEQAFDAVWARLRQPPLAARTAGLVEKMPRKLSRHSSFAESLEMDLPEGLPQVDFDATLENELKASADLMCQLKFSAGDRQAQSKGIPKVPRVTQPDLLLSLVQSCVKHFDSLPLNKQLGAELIKWTNSLQEKIRETIILSDLRRQLLPDPRDAPDARLPKGSSFER